MIRVGIIGCGAITIHRHAPEYSCNPNVELAAYYDFNPDRAYSLSQKYGGRVYKNVDDLLESPDIDAVSICTPNSTHFILSKKALQLNKYVLCEKPMTITLEDAKALVEEERKSDAFLMVAMNQRFTPAHLKAKELIKSKYLGKVLSFSTVFGHSGPENWGVDKSASTWFFNKSAAGFGVAFDLGVHKIDLLRFLLDDEIDSVVSMEGALHKKNQEGNPIDISDNIHCIIKTTNGVIGSGIFSWTFYGGVENSISIYCEKGRINVINDTKLIVSTTSGSNENVTNYSNVTNSGVIDHFIDSIINRRPPAVSALDGYNDLLAVNKITCG